MMRVSSFQIHNLVQNSIQRQEKSYSETIVQMSSGYKINSISDDPLGSVNLIGLERDQSGLDQFVKNAKSVVNSLEQSESYLKSSVDVLYRIQDLTLQAVNDSNADDDREAIARELTTLKETLVGLANSKDEAGNYLFSGSRSDTAPIQNLGPGYTYEGDTIDRKVPVSQGVDIGATVNMSEAYFSPGNFLDDLTAFIDDLNTGSATIGTTGPAVIDGVRDSLSGVTKLQTQIGSRIVSVDSISESQEDLKLANEKIIGDIRDLDYVEAINKINKLEMSMTSTQKTYSKVNELTLFNYI